MFAMTRCWISHIAFLSSVVDNLNSSYYRGLVALLMFFCGFHFSGISPVQAKSHKKETYGNAFPDA